MTAFSRCRRRGVLTATKLHLDHEPPLRPEERRDRRAVENPLRVGFLCPSCHSAKTLEQSGVRG